MKKILSSLAVLFLCVSQLSAAKTPEWVKNKPVADGFYSGVGSAPSTSPEHERQAKDRALADLVSEIQITVENKSLLERIDENGNYSEKYTNDIRTRARSWLGGYELVGTYDDGKSYWVCYRLERSRYEALKKEKSEEASRLALDFWQKGNTALKSGDFINASRLYAEGIKAIEPFGDMRLEVVADGTTMNIASELQYSLSSIFSLFKIQSTPPAVSLNPFSSEASDILIKVSSGDYDLSGIHLTARMDSGEAKVSVRGATDNVGNTRISVSDASARPTRRILTVSPDIDTDAIFDTPALKAMSEKFVGHLRPLNIPVEVKDPDLKAIVVASDAASADLARQIASFVNGNYFDITDNEADADLKFDVSTSFRKGELIHGDMYDMREYFSSASVTVTDINTSTTVTTAVIDDMRTAAPEKTSETKARSDARRQILKRIRKALDSRLLSAKFKRREVVKDTDNGPVRATDEASFCSDDYE